MALDMFTESMKPEAPSSAPAMIKSLLSSTKPIAAAERPAYEFNSEMTVGMSAPPMGTIIITPNIRGIIIISGKRCIREGSSTSSTATTMATPSSDKLTRFWPLYVMGRCGRTSWSLPAAIKLPVSVSEPRMISNDRTAIMNLGTSGARR